MGNPNPEITYPNGLILGKKLREIILPLEAPQTNTRKKRDPSFLGVLAYNPNVFLGLN